MTTVPYEGSEPASVELGLVASLQARLAEQLENLRRRGGASGSLEGRIALIGGLLISAGAIFVLLGWYGASNTSRVYVQIPYLISGGLLGVVLAAAGGTAYLASWLTRISQDQAASVSASAAATTEMTDTLRRIEVLLGGSMDIGAGAQVLAAEYVSTPSGKLAHLPTCPAVAGRTDLRAVEVGPDGPPICRMCDAASS